MADCGAITFLIENTMLTCCRAGLLHRGVSGSIWSWHQHDSNQHDSHQHDSHGLSSMEFQSTNVIQLFPLQITSTIYSTYTSIPVV